MADEEAKPTDAEDAAPADTPAEAAPAAEAAEALAPVIIIKKMPDAHAGAHGGAWKIALADMMTAMMAFF
ncbi:MAG: flagellar motor protein MotB, partial [Betaproteobacteria bacterium]